MKANYIGREKEAGLLENLKNLSKASLAAVYGRRRVGKSSLILETYKDEKIFLFEGLENQPKNKQIDNFLSQLMEYFPDADVSDVENSWYKALSLLYKHTRSLNCVIFFDEFQWMANYRQELVSVLKLVWDRFFAKNNSLVMVLCGSVASFMVNKVIKSKAIYGRIELIIHLKPFKLATTRKFLSQKSEEEVLQAQMLVGGIPGYLNLFKNKNSIFLGIQELGFEEHGYLTTEFDRIFISQFGRLELYEKVIRQLAQNPLGLSRKQLTQEKDIDNGGGLSGVLKDLEIAGFIFAYYSFHLGIKARQKVYVLSDPFLRLYLHFIENDLPAINKGLPVRFTRLINSPKFSSWLGLAFENLCYEHRYELAKIMGFIDVDFNVGPYIGKDEKGKLNLQVDLVYDRKDSVMTVCEIKYQNRAADISLIGELQQKAALLPHSNKTLQYALISKQMPVKAVQDQAFFSHMVEAKQLLSVEI